MNLKITVYLIVGVFSLQNISSEKVIEGLYDKADMVCGPKFGIDLQQLSDFLDDDMILIDPDNKFIQDYTNCWMYEHGFINRAGIINLDNFKKWFVNMGYYHVGKDDIEKYSLITRERTFDYAVIECKAKLKIVLNIRNKESYFYNCMISRIGYFYDN